MDEIKFLYIANTPLIIDKKRELRVPAGGIINPLLFNLRTLINLEFSGHARKVAIVSDKEKAELQKKWELEFEQCQIPLDSLPEKQNDELKETDVTKLVALETEDNFNEEENADRVTDEIKEEIAKLFLSKKAGIKKIAEQFRMKKEEIKIILSEKGLV